MTTRNRQMLHNAPKVVGSNPTVARHIFQACPVWIHTQSNITSKVKPNSCSNEQCWKMSAARKCLTNIFAGNFLTPCRKFLSSHILECNIIHRLFKITESVLQVEIVVCQDWSLSQCAAAPYVLWNLYICMKFYIWLAQEIWIFLPGREIYFLGLKWGQHVATNNIRWCGLIQMRPLRY
jgi:hypothetical protein